jgi:cobalamin biosynthesis protein CobW
MQLLLAQADQLDGIVVETSGLALPEPLVEAFGWPEIRSRVRVNAVVTVVDGEALAAGHVVGDAAAVEAQRQADPSLDHLDALEDLFADQLQAADLVLVSRADRLDGPALAALQGRLASQVRAGTPVLPMTRGEVDASLVLSAPVSTDVQSLPQLQPDHDDHDHDDHDHHGHSHVAMAAVMVQRPGPYTRQELEERLAGLLADQPVLRLKGRLLQEGKLLPLQIQAVGPRLECWYEGVWPEAAPPGLELVVLGAAAHAARLEQAFAAL